MLKHKSKGMGGVNELDDDVLEQAAGGYITEETYWNGQYKNKEGLSGCLEKVYETRYNVFDNRTNKLKGKFSSQEAANLEDEYING